MNRKEVFNHYSAILDNLIDCESFFKYYFQAPFVMIGEDEYLREKWSLYSGATRGCLVDNNYPYVVKFNLIDEENGDYFSSCEKEQAIYEAAAKENLQECLIEPTFIGVYRKSFLFYAANDLPDDFIGYYNTEKDFKYFANLPQENINIEIPLYAYPRAFSITGNQIGSKKSCEIAKRSSGPLSEYVTRVGAKIIDDYGEEYFYALQQLLDDFEVNDIHGGNIMSNACGKVVIIDYAGYGY